MTRPDPRTRWRDAVFSTRWLPDAPRVLALALVDDMDAAGHVSPDRDDLARRLGRPLTRIDERLAVLRRDGWLVQVGWPSKRKPAVWKGQIPVDDGLRQNLRASTPAEPETVQPRRSPAEPETVAVGKSGVTGRRSPAEPETVSIETPDQDDPVATGAHTLRTAAAQTKDAATKNDNDARSPLARALALTPIPRGEDRPA
jgi:hypothetical protein